MSKLEENKAPIGQGMTPLISPEIRDAITAANKKFMASVKQGDAVGMASLYTENGQVLPPNGDFVTGKQELQAFWKALMEMGIKEIKLETNELESYGNTASEVGKYTLYDENGKMLDKGKYVVIWKQKDGQWKLHRDIFNSSMPAPAQ